MNAEQKSAWMGVISLAVCVVAYISLIPFFGPRIIFPVFALYAFVNGFAGLIRKKETPDERDKAIAKRAMLDGFTMSFMAFIFGCLGTWIVVFIFQNENYVQVHVLPMIIVFSGLVHCITRSVAILVHYGRAVEAEDA